MQPRDNAFKARRAVSWTRERIEALSTAEIEQLRINADKLGEAAVAQLCDEVLRSRRKLRRAKSARPAPGVT